MKFTGEGEIFYFQKRIGYLNKPFKIFKFATMIKNSSKIGTGSITLRNDTRVLPVGKFLRKTKLNEIPQIFNVLRGDMSLVGPRPQMEVDLKKFPKLNRDKIYLSMPGITGIGSIFFRDEEKWISNHTGDKHIFYKKNIAPYKSELEIWYYHNSSLLVDFKLLVLTVLVLIFPNKIDLNLFFDNLPIKPKFFDNEK